MKTLHISIMVVIGIAAVLSSFFFLVYPFASNNQAVPSSMPSPQTSTIIIPKDSEEQNSGKNFEPRYLVVVLGLNNTVRWLNEAIVGNTVVADNQDDPLFWNATNYPFNGFLIEGKSFNFTFTKPGEFGYHTEPHPWLHGWVLALPHSTENATQTVVLNGSSNIPGPCEIFGIPCPNNPNFTAQKLGANIYIEKVTVNGVDHYAIIHNSSVCVYPPSISESCTNPDDLAILRLVGVDTSIPQRDVNISIKGLESTYAVGEPIDFGIEVKGYGNCDVPLVLVSTEGYIKWQSKMPVVSCPPGMGVMDRNYSLQDLGGPFSLNQTGTYTLHVGYDFNSTEIQFNVTSTGIGK